MLNESRILPAAKLAENLTYEPELSIPNGQILNLSPNDVHDIESSLQAKFNYEPGECGITFVPLNKTPKILNPIQILENPVTDFDNNPHNRAIAKIGQVWLYWDLVKEALSSGESNFYEYRSFNMLPIYVDESNKLLVETSLIENWNRNYGKTSYSNYIPMINYGGDGDFTGTLKPPPSIPVYLTDGQRIAVPYHEVGVDPQLPKDMFAQAQLVWKTGNHECTHIIESNYSDYPSEIKFIIDKTKKWETELTPFNMTRSYYKHMQEYPTVSEEMFEYCITYLKHITNNEFAGRVIQSPTIAAIQNFSNTLHRMYQQASSHYRI